MLAVLLSAAVVGATSILTLLDKSDKDAASVMNLMCENEAKNIEAQLTSVEQSVSADVSYARDRLTSAQEFFNDESFRIDYTQEMKDLFLEVASNAEGAVTFYYRYNADAITSTEGFLYTRESIGGEFEELPLTDMSLYSPDDTEHVGWYYVPVRRGAPTWMTPYHNKNLDIFMISYVVPIYRDNWLIGVIGMDVNFNAVINQLQEIRPYESSFAAILSEDGTLYYRPEQESESALAAGNVELPNLKNQLEDTSSDGQLLTFEANGQEERFAYQKLSNDMYLVLVADASDIDADRNQLIRRLVVAALVIIVLFAALAIAAGRALLRPLRDLTAAAEAVSRGNLDARLPEARASEVATLIDAYSATVERMRDQMAFIEELAHRDALTELWNKSAYDEHVARLNAAAAQGDTSFAIVMIDVNDLKLVNDTYGHERGDEYLCNAVEVILKAFDGDAVYRIGGDEFVVIVEGDDLAMLDERIASLDATTSACRQTAIGAEDAVTGGKANEPWKHPSLAFGVARFEAGDRSALDVFERADAAMYAKKQEMKGPSATR